jgi:hypothetical protein
LTSTVEREEVGLEQMFMSDDDKQTDAVSGYGKPTTGDYSASDKGFKTFGTMGRGDDAQGLKEEGSRRCKDRDMVVTITAKEDQGAETMRLEVGSYPFQTAADGATYLMGMAL